MSKTMVLMTISSLLLAGAVVAVGGGEREIVSLNGDWQIEESVGATEMPATFTHTAPVPGLVNLARPAFPGVDLFASKEYLQRFGRNYPWGSTNSILAANAPLPAIGISVQKRNYFWYQRTFVAPEKREVALLKIGKSQFGTKVWLNGKESGESLSCWTESTFNLTDTINWKGENRLLVRVGAHPAVLPENIPGAGSYSSKHKWTPGIYDDVRLIFCDNPVIESIQVAPRVGASEVVVQTKVRNYGAARDVELGHVIKSWKEGIEAVRVQPLHDRLDAGEEKTYTQTNRLEKARLWSPEDPFLYVVETRTDGDSLKTRFGMREYRFDNKAGVGYLNGKPYYLRGGNIELFLHVEDPLCGNKPWDRAWVKKLIAEIPKRMNWNAFRFCLSPVPQMWLDIADEEGIMVQLEPIVWEYHKEWDDREMIGEYGRWMRDNWNHPCVFMWDSNNETVSGKLAQFVNAVRPLDLSGRAWDNGWSAPAGPDDPSEAHPYLLIQNPYNKDLRHFNDFDAGKTAFEWYKSFPGHCRIINEYCWLWQYPDGVPILNALVGPGTVQERREYRWYMTAALTEMWRSQRCAVGVFYYVYLASYLPRNPGPYHLGAFDDLQTLKLQPEFEKYMTESFKPLGVYLKFWGDGKPGTVSHLDSWFPIKGGDGHSFTVMLVNDDSEPVTGKLVLSVENLEGKTIVSTEKPFRLDGVGRNTYELAVSVPKECGKYRLKAVAYPQGVRHKSPTVCIRQLSVVPVAVAPASPAAKIKTATASSQYDATFDAGKAIDDILTADDVQNCWVSANQQDIGSWWQADMGALTPIPAIQIQFRVLDDCYIFVPKTITFQVSDDGNTWRTVVSKSTNVPAIRSKFNGKQYEYAIRDKGRYVRLLFEDGTDHQVGDSKVVELVEVRVVKEDASAAAIVPPAK
jgi:hypothetical protein